MMKIKMIIPLFFIIFMIVSVLVYAVKIKEISFYNHLQTGSVDIQIEQYEETENGEKIINDGIVMPNQNVSYIPRVSNLKAPGYVRVRMEIVMDDDISFPITSQHVFGISDSWIKTGDYFYCTEVMSTGEKSDVFKGFNVPDNWTQEDFSGFKIRLYAEVIQDRNFKPDFESEYPWGDVATEEAKQEDNITYGRSVPIESNIQLEYTSEEGLCSNVKNLFKEFDYFMAGDRYEDSMRICNKSKHEIKVYLRTRATEKELLKKMKLRICFKEEEIYYGDLVSEKLSDYRQLAVIKPEDNGEFKYEVLLPENSQNEYSVLCDKVIWQFKVDEVADTNVRTADRTNIHFMIIIMMISLAIMILIASAKRGNRV